MHYNIKGQILGFPDLKKVTIEEIDKLFAKMQDVDTQELSFILVNPYMLRDYFFNMPLDVSEALKIDKNSKVSIYAITVIQQPLERSTVNFLAPIVINHDEKLIAQALLDPIEHPDFGMAERIESFKKIS